MFGKSVLHAWLAVTATWMLAVSTQAQAVVPEVPTAATVQGAKAVGEAVRAVADGQVPFTSQIEFVSPNTTFSSTKPCVVLVPGLLAGTQSLQALREKLSSQSYDMGVFRYPSQQGVKSAAAGLSQQLLAIKSRSPQTKVILVTHSMGGLVARYCVENATLSPGNVNQLIMIAPPNRGSALAALSAEELANRFAWIDPTGEATWKSIDELVQGFVGAARAELAPGSAVLNELDSLERAPGIQYCIFAGCKGPLSRTVMQSTFLLGSLFLPDDPRVRQSWTSAQEIVCLDEWTQGCGDGIVSVESTRLAGVDDHVVLPFGHNDFTTEQHLPLAVVEQVRQRLGDPLATASDGKRTAERTAPAAADASVIGPTRGSAPEAPLQSAQ